jgi:hypothetical protein
VSRKRGHGKGTAPKLDGFEQREAWRESLRFSCRATANLLIERDNFDYLLLNMDPNTVMGDIIRSAGARWYEHFIAAAIRRETDESKDSHSALRVLREMASNGTQALTFNGNPIDLKTLRKDKKRLERLSARAKFLADKEVTHATMVGVEPNERPSIEEMHECGVEFHEVVAKYTLMLCGVTLLKALPGQGVRTYYIAGTRFEPMGPTRETVGAYFGVPALDLPKNGELTYEAETSFAQPATTASSDQG